MKKYLSTFSKLLFLVTILFINYIAQAQSGKRWTREQADKWYNSRKWLNGLSLTPHASIDQAEFARQYLANPTGWDIAFAYMKKTDLNSLTPGKFPIDGENVYITVTEGPGKDFNQAKWESHHNYSDIHYMVIGREKIGLTPVSSARITEAYDPARDILFYTATGKYYINDPSTFFIIPPKYAHRPSIKVDGDEVVKKIVIKVRTTPINTKNKVLKST
jgi:YhcH/YjgK/YiaL family protein